MKWFGKNEKISDEEKYCDTQITKAKWEQELALKKGDYLLADDWAANQVGWAKERDAVKRRSR